VEAIVRFSELQPDVTPPLDITMPEKDGLTALKEILALDPSARVVMCSALGQESRVLEAIKSGAKDFVVKPFQQERVPGRRRPGPRLGPSAAVAGVDDRAVPMKRFAFRLESLRALREQGRGAGQAVLGRELALEALAPVLGWTPPPAVLSQAGAQPYGFGIDLVARQAYVERCERELTTAEHQLHQTQAMVTSRRTELGEAARQRKTLERLKERQRDLHDLEAQRARGGRPLRGRALTL